MRKINRCDYRNLSLLIAFFLIVVLVLTRGVYLYGSVTDWQNQYWAFSEYFRNLYYSSHSLLPNFAFNIGGGQNIYNFSYYGLFSPVILLSYFFPFIKMLDYIILSSILTVIISIVLFYLWLRSNDYEQSTCFLITFLFLCAGPILFQSHRQIMFINYIPFLLLCFWGIDRFCHKRKSLLLIISVFLMIMTSYYYSVGGIIALAIYAVYKHLKMNRLLTIKSLISYMINVSIRILIGVLGSSVLILPTFMALLNGRSSNAKDSLFTLSLFIPRISLQDILYNPYSLGLTSIAIISILGGFIKKKKEDFFLSTALVVIIVFPVFNYALNGTLYMNAKVLIPFLPIACLSIANYIEDLFCTQMHKKRIAFIFLLLVLVLIVAVQWEYNVVFIIDSLITGIAIVISVNSGKKKILYASLLVISIASCLIVNISDKLLSDYKEDQDFSSKNENLMDSVLKADKSFFRFSNNIFPIINVNKVYAMNYYQTTVYSSVYNKEYYDLYYNIFNNEMSFRNTLITNPTNNILFDMYMGNKYVITDKKPPIGYKFLKTNGKASVYINDDVYPLGYATNKVMSESQFNNLQYPYNVEALFNYGIVKEEQKDNFDSKDDFAIERLSTTIEKSSIEYHNVTMKKTDGAYFIKASAKASMTVKLKKALTGKIVFIRFHMERQSDTTDTGITINGIKNKLTSKDWKYQNKNYEFDYVLSSNNVLDTLNIQFMKGEYQISNIEVYALDYNSIKENSSALDAFIVDTGETYGDKIAGKISVKNDGYFILNIPYDKGFVIKVDGRKVAYEKVNKAFIGFKIEKGERKIDITYQAPLQRQGFELSLISIILTVLLILGENKRLFSKK